MVSWVRTHGDVPTPLLVRPSPQRMGWEIVDGRLRLAAATRAGLDSISCTVADLTDAEVAERSFLDPAARMVDHPVRRARALAWMRTLVKDGRRLYPDGASLANRLGRPVSSVNSDLALARLPPLLLDAVERGEVHVAPATTLGQSVRFQEHPDCEVAILATLRGHSAAMQKQMVDFLVEVPQRLDIPLDAMPRIVLKGLSGCTPEQRKELQDAYAACGLDPTSIDWRRVGPAEYPAELAKKRLVLLVREAQARPRRGRPSKRKALIAGGLTREEEELEREFDRTYTSLGSLRVLGEGMEEGVAVADLGLPEGSPETIRAYLAVRLLRAHLRAAAERMER